ncbi:MAG: class I SAM-dependent RNA methyltransferase [Acidobacteriota bacterium]
MIDTPGAGTDRPPRPGARRKVRLYVGHKASIEIDKLVAGGGGMGRFEGLPVFVPRTAPGDLVRIEVIERWRDYAKARLLEVLRPGPSRRQPRCAHFEQCGGCDLQHIEDDAQLRFKAEAVRETLSRIGGVGKIPEIEVVAGDAWGYRQRAQLQVAPTERGVRVGYFARGTHDLVPIDQCPILDPELENRIPEINTALENSTIRRLDIASGDGSSWTTAPVVEGLPHGAVDRRVGDHAYTYDARAFFQGHRSLVADLVRHTVGEWTGDTVFDLYAGVGLFSIPLAARYRRVVSVENDRIATRWARQNRRRSRVDHVEAIDRSVESMIDALPADLDRVVVDPPRAGLSPKVRNRFLKAPPRLLTYVSCHAAALARDIRALSGHYRVGRLVLLDMFPQTGHMEVVAHLRRDGT